MAIYLAQSLLTLPVKSGSSPLLRPMAQLPGAKRSTSDTIIYASHHLASEESISLTWPAGLCKFIGTKECIYIRKEFNS